MFRFLPEYWSAGACAPAVVLVVRDTNVGGDGGGVGPPHPCSGDEGGDGLVHILTRGGAATHGSI